ncbi:MAG TPA: hypothetical protein VNN10_16180 [Dehalococcoidia bacterium]|nr:hypothetical protein [Dehalococcoidia bacterium]
MSAQQSEEEGTGAGMVVYLCTGRRVVLPSVSFLTLRDDKIVCRSAEGVELASFPMAEVYMCSRKQLPAAPP